MIEAFVGDTLSSIAAAHTPNKNRVPKKLSLDTVKIIKEVTGIMKDLADLRKLLPTPEDKELKEIPTEDLLKSFDDTSAKN